MARDVHQPPDTLTLCIKTSLRTHHAPSNRIAVEPATQQRRPHGQLTGVQFTDATNSCILLHARPMLRWVPRAIRTKSCPPGAHSSCVRGINLLDEESTGV